MRNNSWILQAIAFALATKSHSSTNWLLQYLVANDVGSMFQINMHDWQATASSEAEFGLNSNGQMLIKHTLRHLIQLRYEHISARLIFYPYPNTYKPNRSLAGDRI